MPPDKVQQGKGANYEVYGKYTMMKDKNYFWFGAVPFRPKLWQSMMPNNTSARSLCQPE